MYYIFIPADNSTFKGIVQYLSNCYHFTSLSLDRNVGSGIGVIVFPRTIQQCLLLLMLNITNSSPYLAKYLMATRNAIQ